MGAGGAATSIASWLLSNNKNTGKQGLFTSTHEGGKFNYVGFANPKSNPDMSSKDMLRQNFTDPAGVLSWFGGSGDSDSSLEYPSDFLTRPEYYEDPDYRGAQNTLSGLGSDILSGNIPEYYKAIGETGSPEFEDMLGMTKRDITQSTTESLAKGGRARGGQLAASTAKAVGDASIGARYQDYARSLIGKQGLLNTGVGITEGVRGAGQKEGGNVNQFNWNDYNARFKEYALAQEMAAAEDANSGSFLGNIIGMATGSSGSGSGQSLLGKIGSLFKNNNTSSTMSDYTNTGYDYYGNAMSMAQ